MTEEEINEAVAHLLIAHTRSEIRRCHCGWGELGRSHAVHVARKLREAGLLKEPLQ